MDGHFITISRLRERASRLAAGLAALGVLALLGGCTTVSGPQFAAERPVDPAMVAMYAAVEDGPVVVPAIDVRRVDPQFLRQIVTLPPQIQERPGTIVVDPSNRFLYLVQEDGQALRYGIGVGRQGFGWAGEATIHNKQEWPKWFPPVEMMARDEKAAQYADGMDGGLDNPLGARALYLWQGKQDLVDVSRLKLMERQALETADRLRSLASELSLSEERTRRAIAQTLHDEVGQTLALACMKISSAHNLPKDKAMEKFVQEQHDMLVLAIKQTRALMVEISPPGLHDLGLEAAIDWMAERMSSEHGIAIEMVETGNFLDLEQDLRIMLYQMTKELLVNIVKHSGASHVLVTVERDDHTISIKAKDDGKGFNARGGLPPLPTAASGSSASGKD